MGCRYDQTIILLFLTQSDPQLLIQVTASVPRSSEAKTLLDTDSDSSSVSTSSSLTLAVAASDKSSLFWSDLAVNAAQLIILYGLRCLFVLRNSANKKRRLEQRGSEQVQTDNAFDDLTDRKNIDFVYHYVSSHRFLPFLLLRD